MKTKRKTKKSKATDLGEWISVAQAAQMVNVSNFWMRTLVQNGKIEGWKIGSSYVVKKESAKEFERHPSAGRPRN